MRGDSPPWQRQAPGLLLRSLRILSLLVLAVLAAGCTASPVTSLSETERATLGSGALVLVLLRVEVDVDIEILGFLPGSGSEQAGRSVHAHAPGRIPNLYLEIGSFESAGVPVAVQERGLSAGSLAAGWRVLLLEPGIYYPALGTSPRQRIIWRMDVPRTASVLYAGSVTLRGKAVKFFTADSPIVLRELEIDAVRVADDRPAARRELADHGFDPTGIEPAGLRQWRPGETLVFRAPVPSQRSRPFAP